MRRVRCGVGTYTRRKATFLVAVAFASLTVPLAAPSFSQSGTPAGGGNSAGGNSPGAGGTGGSGTGTGGGVSTTSTVPLPRPEAATKDAYIVEFKAYIPQESVVDPRSLTSEEGTLDVTRCRPRPGFTSSYPPLHADYKATIQSSYEGDGHRGFHGTFRARQVMTFDFDGHHISNLRSSRGSFNFGVTRRIFEQRDRSGIVTKRCVVERNDSGVSLARRTSPGGLDRVDARLKAKNPLSQPAAFTPSLDALFSITFADAATARVSWQTDGYPSFAYSIVRNGVQITTSVVQDVSCSPVTGVAGAAHILSQLSPPLQEQQSRDVNVTVPLQTDNRFCR